MVSGRITKSMGVGAGSSIWDRAKCRGGRCSFSCKRGGLGTIYESGNKVSYITIREKKKESPLACMLEGS